MGLKPKDKTVSEILNRLLISKDKESTKNKLHFFILYFRLQLRLIEVEIEETKDLPMVFEVIK